MSSLFISIIIPCYNEKENLERGVLNEVEDFLKEQNFSWEVIVSDDGSTDNSRELVKKAIAGKKHFRLLENRHGGKPSAIWEGIKRARGERILFTDMDQSAPLKELSKLLPYFDQYEVVIGSRGTERENFDLVRKAGSFAFRLFRKSILLPGINDTQCGFKAFKTEVAKKVFPQLEFFRQKQEVSGWKVTSFDVELLFLVEKYGYRIKEVPVEWKNEDVSTGKKKSYFKESKEMLAQILRVKLNDLRGLYEKRR